MREMETTKQNNLDTILFVFKVKNYQLENY